MVAQGASGTPTRRDCVSIFLFLFLSLQSSSIFPFIEDSEMFLSLWKETRIYENDEDVGMVSSVGRVLDSLLPHKGFFNLSCSKHWPCNSKTQKNKNEVLLLFILLIFPNYWTYPFLWTENLAETNHGLLGLYEFALP